MSELPAARRRIRQTPELNRYAFLLLGGDLQPDDSHWHWLATAPVPEIVAWARSILER